MKTYDLVVIGAGAAGNQAAQAARKENHSASILVIQEENDRPYDRTVLSSRFLSISNDESIYLHPPDWYDEQRIELRTGCVVQSVDRDARTVELGPSGDVVGYGTLVLATGSVPLVPQSALAHRDDTYFVLRSLGDAKRLEKGLSRARNILIAGMGVLAVEVAEQLRKAGKKVTLLGATPQLIPRQLNARAGEILENVLSRNGVTLRFQEEIMRFERNKKGRWSVETLRDTLHCDAVLFCIGTEPRRNLAESAGIECGRGIRVNTVLQTSDPAIFAAGDCAEHPDGTVTNLWAAAEAQGALAGRNALNPENPIAWDNLPFVLKSEVYGQVIFSAGKPARLSGYEIQEIEEEKRYLALYCRDEAIHGAILLNDPDRQETLNTAVRERWDRTRFLQTIELE